MAGGKQESVSLSKETINFVEGLARLGIYGKKKSHIYRHFIEEGVNAVIRDDMISKHQAAKSALEKVK